MEIIFCDKADTFLYGTAEDSGRCIGYQSNGAKKVIGLR
jgi:hypothetical protein